MTDARTADVRMAQLRTKVLEHAEQLIPFMVDSYLKYGRGLVVCDENGMRYVTLADAVPLLREHLDTESMLRLETYDPERQIAVLLVLMVNENVMIELMICVPADLALTA